MSVDKIREGKLEPHNISKLKQELTVLKIRILKYVYFYYIFYMKHFRKKIITIIQIHE